MLLSGWVMFHMGEDVKILAVTAASALTAVVAALVLARSIVGSIDRVRGASVELARGDLEVRVPEHGPAEVAELAASFNEMGDNLRRLFDSRRELVAWASHDLRTPLASMQAMLEAVEDDLAAPEEYVPVLREQVRVLSVLVDDLFELARIDAGALTLEMLRLPMAPIVSSSLKSIEAEARSRHVRLDADVDEEITARFEPDKVERVLMNLLTNALRHTPSDGAVAVLVEPTRTRCASPSRTRARGSTWRRVSGCSSGSGAATSRAPPVGQGSGSRSRAGSSRPTAAGSGRRTARAAALACASRCPPADQTG